MANDYYTTSGYPAFNQSGASSSAREEFELVQTAFDDAETDIDLKANAADSALTGTPVAPTATVDTDTTQIATTAFVLAQAGDVVAIMAGVASAGLSERYSRMDHRHPHDTDKLDVSTASTTYAPLASPTLTGDPKAPTATEGDNDTSIATTAFVTVAVASAVSALVDGAPATLDTMNEIAAAIADDDNFATTMTTALSTKAPLISPALTGIPTVPTAVQDVETTQAASTAFVLNQASDSTPLQDESAAVVGTSERYSRGNHVHPINPVIQNNTDAAAASAAAALVSENNSADSETNAATSESNAATSESNAAASYDSFDDRYLGAKSSAPSVDNDGDPLIFGAMYFNSSTDIMYVYGGSGWQAAGSSVNGTSGRYTYTATSSQTDFAATYDAGYVDVYLNGSKLQGTVEFTATNGTNVVLATGATTGDIVDIVAYGTFELSTALTGPASATDNAIVLFDGVTGKLAKDSTVTISDLQGTTLGKQTIFIPAGAMTAQETSGAEAGSIETTTNKVMLGSMDFDATADEFAQFQVKMPESWDAGTVTAQFVWSHPSTSTNFGVRFFIQGVSIGDGDAGDTAFGTAVGHTADTGGTTDDIYTTVETGAITISNTPAKSDYVIFQVYRDVSDAGDTMAVDARLHGVALFYTTDSATDD